MKIFLLFLFLFPGSLAAQNQFSGKLIDTETKEPVAYVNIGLKGTSKGTFSNELGEFVLASENEEAEIVFSHIAYETQTVKVKNLGATIFLQPVPKILAEVFISDDPDYAYNLVRKAFEKHEKVSKKNFYGKAFYRQLTKLDDNYTEFQELFFDVRFSSRAIEGWKAKQGRFALQKDSKEQPSIRMTNFSYLNAFPVFQKKKKIVPDMLLHPVGGFADYFDFQIVSVTNEIALVTFSAKPGKPEVMNSNGELYIHLKKHWIYKIIYRAQQNAERAYGRGKRRNSHSTFEVNLGEKDGFPQIEYIKNKNEFDFFTKNDSVQSKIVVESLLFFYDYPAKMKKRGMEKLKLSTDDLKRIQKLKYDPQFWKNNPIVKRTPLEEGLIESFEREGSFSNFRE